MIRQAIQKIMCCCGNGVGTSLIMQMTIEEALEYLGMDDIEVSFGSLSDISADRADYLLYLRSCWKVWGICRPLVWRTLWIQRWQRNY